MNKCDFCDMSVLKEGKLECSLADRSASYRAVYYCGHALDEFKKFAKDNGKEDKES